MTDDDPDLVMPFVVCQTNGGPYDDDSFTSGFAAGQIYAEMAAGQIPDDQTIRVPLGAQLDLMAMRFGLNMQCYVCDDCEPVEWITVRFTRDVGRQL